MGAAREVTFASLAEPALFLCAARARRARPGTLSLSGMLGAGLPRRVGRRRAGARCSPRRALRRALAENSRIPVDDPTTHLELTMIHEVMVLDHGGPDLALILYGAALKLFLFGALLVAPRPRLAATARSPPRRSSSSAALLGFAVAVGVVESVMARLRIVRVPQLLVGASVLSALRARPAPQVTAMTSARPTSSSSSSS